MNNARHPSLSSPTTIPLSTKTSSRSRNHLFAGSLGGLLASATLQPLDVIKTRFQQGSHGSLSTVYKSILGPSTRISNLWRGTTASCLRSSLGSGLYFLILHELRTLKGTSALDNLLTGGIARASVGFVMMPITIIKVRYESSYYAYSSLVSATKDIYRHHGVRGFFYGWGATAIRDAPYAGLYVLVYEDLKLRMGGWGNTTMINFCAGLGAGFGATLVTNPFDVLRTRMQLKPEKYSNVPRALKVLLKEEGGRALFDGVGLRIARKSLSSAITWTLYEFVLASI